MIIVPLSFEEIQKIITEHCMKKYKGKVTNIEPEFGQQLLYRDDYRPSDSTYGPTLTGLKVTIQD